MYRVLLVDDEPWALLGIRNCCDWSASGFEIIHQTTDPLEALNVIKTKKPDVVFTDIRMHDLSGLDLMKKVRAEDIDTEFVIISGYGEFSYAKKAIEYGAFHYLLKPIERQEVYEVIKKLAIYLDEKKKNKNLIKRLEFLDSLSYESSSITEIAADSGIEFTYPLYQVVVAIGTDLYNFVLSDFPENTLHLTMNLGSNKNAYFINTSFDIGGYACQRWANNKSLKAITFGISTTASDPDEIGIKFREADVAANSTFITGDNGVYVYSKKNSSKIAILIDSLIDKLDTGKTDIAVSDLLNLPSVFKSEGLGMEEVAFLFNQFIAIISYRYPESDIQSELEFLTYDMLLQRYKNLSDLCQWFADIVKMATRTPESSASDEGNSFNNLLKYVHANYNQAIQLSDLSEMFHLNLTYICDLFKKNTGKTLTEYLTQLRMDRASYLLRETSYPIIRIADEVGYGDYCYFSKIFKKHFGVPPMKYRSSSRS